MLRSCRSETVAGLVDALLCSESEYRESQGDKTEVVDRQIAHSKGEKMDLAPGYTHEIDETGIIRMVPQGLRRAGCKYRVRLGDAQRVAAERIEQTRAVPTVTGSSSRFEFLN